MWGKLLRVVSAFLLSGAVSGCVITTPIEIAYAIKNRIRYCLMNSGEMYTRNSDCSAGDTEIESTEYQRRYANQVEDQTRQTIAANEAARNAKTYCLAGRSETPYIAASGQCQFSDSTISETEYLERKARARASLGAQVPAALPTESPPESTPSQTSKVTPSKPAAPAVKPTQTPKAAEPALDPIPGPTIAKPVTSGTAFFVADEGRLVTNFHVVDGCHWIGLVADGEIHPAVTLAQDRDLDLAILQTDFDSGGVAVFADQQPDIGDDSYVAGYPLLSQLWSLNFTNGIISSQAPLGELGLLQTTAPVQHGNSGGPMFDASGHVVGIVVARLKDDSAENVNFAIKSEVAISFIRQSGIAPRIAKRGKDLKASAIAKSARSMVVPAICFKQMGSPGTID